MRLNIMTNETALLRDYVRRKGLKDTPQREEVLAYLSKAGGHRTPEEVFVSLRKRDPRIGRATVFRTLKLLEECGLASRLVSIDGRSRYERAYGRLHHDHMICVDCGETLEFESPEVEKIQERVAAASEFKLLWHLHELFGRCRLCAKKKGGLR